jgi:hypothetical protein
MEREDFNLTDKQINACKEIKKAIKNAQKLGLKIMAKSDTLMAYQRKPYDLGLVAELHRTAEFDYNNDVPCTSICIIDGSGADDMEWFKEGAFHNQ